MSFDTSAVTGTPSEFEPLLALAVEHDLCVTPFPPKSFLWTSPPDGWSWGTDSWHMSLRPHLVEFGDAPGVTWMIEYSDDDGHHAWIDRRIAAEIIEGKLQPWQDS